MTERYWFCYTERALSRRMARRYWHKIASHHRCGNTCARCWAHWLTGRFYVRRIAHREQFKAMRATTSWWPIEWRTLSSGRRYGIRIKP